MPGIDDPAVVDAVTQTADGEVVLVISHDRPWTDTPDEVDRLGRKLDAYAGFVVDGGFASAYPEAADRPKRVQIDCVDPPTPQVADLISRAGSGFAPYGIGVGVALLPSA